MFKSPRLPVQHELEMSQLFATLNFVMMGGWRLRVEGVSLRACPSLASWERFSYMCRYCVSSVVTWGDAERGGASRCAVHAVLNCMSVILLPRSPQSLGNMFDWTREGSGKC